MVASISSVKTNQTQQVPPVANRQASNAERSLFAGNIKPENNIFKGASQVSSQPAAGSGDIFTSSQKVGQNVNQVPSQQIDFKGENENSKVNLVTGGMNYKAAEAVNKDADQKFKGEGLANNVGPVFVNHNGKLGVAGSRLDTFC